MAHIASEVDGCVAVVRKVDDVDAMREDNDVAVLREELRRCRKSLEDSVCAVKTLTDSNSRLLSMNEHLQLEVQRLNETLIHSTQQSVQGGTNFAEQCFEIFKEATERDEKKENLVLLGIPEGKCGEEETNRLDKDLAEDLVKKCGLCPGDILKTYRHGSQREGRPRTLKIKFNNKITPAKVLTIMRERKLYHLLPAQSRIRRDLTTREQIKERDARSEAYQRNSKDNMFNWTVNANLDVVRVKTPRPWQLAGGGTMQGNPENSDRNVTSRRRDVR